MNNNDKCGTSTEKSNCIGSGLLYLMMMIMILCSVFIFNAIQFRIANDPIKASKDESERAREMERETE
jgi:hypothetical protein